MLRHSLRLTARWQRAGGRYRVRRWPRFSPASYDRLAGWFGSHGRRWPWREPGLAPWALLLAEMLLRRTAANHVEKVWPELLRRYPTPAALAAAQPDDVAALIAPLGMSHVRAAGLQDTARAIAGRHAGEVPVSSEELLALPHVGPYTANAVRCFAHGIASPIVDVNILRIFHRYFGLGTRTKNPHREPHIWLQAGRLLPERHADQYQYALLDLAALVCRHRRPDCQSCPLRSGCRSAKA